MTHHSGSCMRFRGKRVLITGGTSGIGLAGAKRIHEEGGDAIVTGTDELKIREIKSRWPYIQTVINDAVDSKSAGILAESVPSPLDGIWINAGYARIGSIKDTTDEQLGRMIAVNFRSPFSQLSSLYGHLHAGSSVVLTSSSSVYEGNAVTSAYAATKSAVAAAVRSWATELASKGVRINTLVPGAIDTGFRSFLPGQARDDFVKSVVDNTPMGRLGTVDEAASVALFLLSDDSSYMTGTQVFVDGGLLRR